MADDYRKNIPDPFEDNPADDPFADENAPADLMLPGFVQRTLPEAELSFAAQQIPDDVIVTESFDPSDLDDTVFLEDSEPDIKVPVYAEQPDEDEPDYLIQDTYDDYDRPLDSPAPNPNPVYTLVRGGVTPPSTLFSIFFFAVMAVCIGLSGYNMAARYIRETALLDRDSFFRVSVGEAVLTGMSKEEALDYVNDTYSEESFGQSVQFIGETDSFSVPLSVFSPVYDTEKVVDEAWGIGHSGTRTQRLRAIYASNGVPVRYAAPCTLTASAISAYVEELAEKIDLPVKEPSIAVNPDNDGENDLFLMEEEQTGKQLDREQLTRDITDCVRNDFKPIRLHVETLEPSATLAELKENVQLIRSFTTKYDYLPNRVYNIHRATDVINGTVLQPGEIFSFNGLIGNTSIPSNGYKEWYVIIGGKSEMDYGGGVCQAATTLYNAAVRCDMEILERAPHSIASSYVPRGQDATIAYGAHDMSFRNTSDHPIYIFGSYTNTSVTFQIWGRPLEDGVTIEMESELLGTHAPGDPVITQDSSKPAGFRETTLTALNGYDVRVYKVWFNKDGVKIRSVVDHTDNYPSRRAQITVGPEPVSTPAPTAVAPTPTPTSTAPPAPTPPETTPDQGDGSETP
ncbi:MAG: VanW family protein [Clostridia bacterium]|nr:VanW family protein [Clostridia bacterium]